MKQTNKSIYRVTQGHNKHSFKGYVSVYVLVKYGGMHLLSLMHKLKQVITRKTMLWLMETFNHRCDGTLCTYKQMETIFPMTSIHSTLITLLLQKRDGMRMK